MGKKEISKIFKLPIGWWKRVPSFQSSQALRPRNRRSGPRRRGNTWVGSIASSNSHTQVHASRTNRWIGDHVIQYFLFTTLSNHLLLHLSQMKLNEINCWRVWIWRAHTSCASGKLPYTDLSSDVCWSCDITKQVTFFYCYSWNINSLARGWRSVEFSSSVIRQRDSSKVMNVIKNVMKAFCPRFVVNKQIDVLSMQNRCIKHNNTNSELGTH